jgi:hypothetical protein
MRPQMLQSRFCLHSRLTARQRRTFVRSRASADSPDHGRAADPGSEIASALKSAEAAASRAEDALSKVSSLPSAQQPGPLRMVRPVAVHVPEMLEEEVSSHQPGCWSNRLYIDNPSISSAGPSNPVPPTSRFSGPSCTSPCSVASFAIRTVWAALTRRSARNCDKQLARPASVRLHAHTLSHVTRLAGHGGAGSNYAHCIYLRREYAGCLPCRLPAEY